jgi:Trk K+ transport system NAD-binding subunit
MKPTSQDSEITSSYVGMGQVGRTIVDQLNRLKIPFVLIETNDGLCRELVKEGTSVIQGDAKRHDVLTMAGIAQARCICIVIDNDADNLYCDGKIAKSERKDHHPGRSATLRRGDTEFRS